MFYIFFYVIGSLVSLLVMAKVSKLNAFRSIVKRNYEWYFTAILSWLGVLLGLFILSINKYNNIVESKKYIR